MKLKHIFIAALVPLLLLSISISISESMRLKEVNLIGIVVALYYLIPSVLFSLSYTALLKILFKSKLDFLFKSWIGQIALSLVLGLLFLIFWIVFEGSPYNYRGMSFSMYWASEVGRYWLVLLCFGIPIPVILNFFARNKRRMYNN